MCRHLAYLGPPVALARLLIEPAHGLYEQSWAPRQQKHGVVNADGFGVGWYPEGEEARPARYRRAVPIWADTNLTELARVVRSGAVLAAVRSATEGTSREESAAAPFRDGGFLFSHNGAVPDWAGLVDDLGQEQVPAVQLLTLESSSDSALLWALICGELRRGAAPQDALITVVRRTAAARPGVRLNFLMTDGETVYATRHGDTLWYRTGPDSVLVASEPDEDPRAVWHEVPDDSLLLATPAGVHTTSLHAVIGEE